MRSTVNLLGKMGSVAIAVTLLSGCLMTRSQLQEKNEKQVLQTQLQETKANVTVQYADLEEQLRESRGRIEVLENGLRVSRAAESESRNLALEEKRRIDERLKLYEEAISKLEKDVQTLSSGLEEQSKSSPGQDSPSKGDGKKKSTFDRADSLFEAKKWREAIVEFQKYRDSNPSGKSYSDATYKIGVSFQELGLKDEAKAFYNEVVGKYPKSKSADKAKVRLKQLK